MASWHAVNLLAALKSGYHWWEFCIPSRSIRSSGVDSTAGPVVERHMVVICPGSESLCG